MSFIEAKISLRSACALRCYNILFQCWLTSSPTLSMTSHAYFHFIALFTIWSLLFGRFHALKLSVLTFKRPQRHAGSIGQINRSNVRKQLSLFAINNQKDVTMPALSSTMKQGRVISWNKRVGDAVATGDMLLVVESDKADMDVEAYDSGYLGAIYVAAGETAPVGATLATIVENKQDLALLAGSLPERTDKTPESPQSIGVGKIDTGESKSSELSNKLMGPSFQTINMPALSSTMKEGKVITWNKRIGDKVMSGDILLVVESDKADMDVEAFADGYLAHIVVNEGEKAAVASPVAYLVDRYEDMESFQVFLKTSHSQSLKEDQFISSSQLIPHIQSETNITPSSTPSSVVNNGRIAASGYAKQLAKEKSIDLRTVIPSRSDGYITSKDLMSQSVKKHAVVVSPMAKRLAVEHGVDLSKVTGTGNFGRIIPDDVLRAAGKLTSVDSTVSISKHHSVINPTGEEANRMQVTSLKQLDEVEALTNLQLAVAKNMENSLSVPVFRVSRDIMTDRFDELYTKLKPSGVTASTMIAKAVALTLARKSFLNSCYVDGAMKHLRDINIAMAVAIPGGLITPTLKNADKTDIFALSRTWKDLVDRAKLKKLSPEEYSSGTFTISNLGMFGVSQFDAILPPGTGAILAIAASLPRVMQLPNGYFGVQKFMTVTVTADHRHIYGAHVAEFLTELANVMENEVHLLTMS